MSVSERKATGQEGKERAHDGRDLSKQFVVRESLRLGKIISQVGSNCEG